MYGKNGCIQKIQIFLTLPSLYAGVYKMFKWKVIFKAEQLLLAQRIA